MAPIDGLELTKQVMATAPRPILVISNSVKTDDTKNIVGLLQAGAVDISPNPWVMTTPSTSKSNKNC